MLKTWRDSATIDMFLSAVSVLVVVQQSSEVPEGLMNNPVLYPDVIPSRTGSGWNATARYRFRRQAATSLND
jgi:hypothetical protein